MAGGADRGNGFAIYSLAAGLCTFIGPVLYTVLAPLVGTTGVVFVYAGLFLFSTVLTLTLLRVPDDPAERALVAA
jgi:MFS-type transporter involved in bile tolerance (Atg22 family)